MLAAQMSVPSMSRELSLLPFWKRLGEERGCVTGSASTRRTNGQKASSRPSPGKGCSAPPSLVPRFVILGSLEAGVSILAGAPSKSSEDFGADPWAPPCTGCSLQRCLTELCGQVQNPPTSPPPQPMALSSKPPRGRVATTTGSLVAVASPQAGALQSQVPWRVHVGESTSPLPEIGQKREALADQGYTSS